MAPRHSTSTVRMVEVDRERALVERLADREPVHPVQGPDDLAGRTAADRRIFVLEREGRASRGRGIHADSGRPQTVVWVALAEDVPARIDDVLDASRPAVDPASATVAVFYSIWNVPGADGSGSGRGRELIEGATALLADELPALETFVTLSPAPGLARLWEPAWPDPGDEGFASAAARALISLDERGRPRDPVARFHLGNGARLWRVNTDADPSPTARQRSFGVMVNYRYEPEDRAANRAELAAGFVPVSSGVARLLG